LELALTAQNWSGDVTVRSALDGRVVNDGAALYRPFDNRHLEPVACGSAGDEGIYLVVRTNQSDLRVAVAARTRAFVRGEGIDALPQRIEQRRYVAEELSIRLS